MKELKSIIAEYERLDKGQDLALATVVRVRGSSYRSPGARMLIRRDGRWTGSISGGCLEGDALRKARKVMSSGDAMLVTYDTMDDNNNTLGVGLGCNGIIDVLIEPVNQENNPIEKLKIFTTYDNLTVLATVFQSDNPLIKLGQQMWFNEKVEIESDFEDQAFSTSLEKEIKQALASRKPFIKRFEDDQVEVFFEIIEPSIDLILFGGGFDAKPVVTIAATLGWEVTVTDECVAHAAPVNFPEAHVSFCRRENFSGNIPIKPYSAAVLMSHTYDYDLAALKMLLQTNIAYIGILGPKKRVDKMFDELEHEGIKLKPGDMDRIHSPVGLDIGAETPEEIALSIITEIQTKFTNRSGGFLKYRKAPIHQRDGKKDQVFKQVYINSDHQRNTVVNS